MTGRDSYSAYIPDRRWNCREAIKLIFCAGTAGLLFFDSWLGMLVSAPLAAAIWRRDRQRYMDMKKDQMKVSLDPDSHKRSVWILLLGMAVASVFLLLMNSRLKDRVKNRDNMLMMQYPSFVTRLSLLLQTGMTLKNSLEHMAYDVDKPNLLEQELSYALHEIETGSDEAAVYETLGNRLGLPQYIRLMNHISQNLRLGTRDIRKIMEEEVMFSMESRLENARKKGEEAATKLIFPMVILLAVVMIILIIPAVAGF